MGLTRRKEIIDRLRRGRYTVRFLADELDMGVTDAADELGHALRSLREGRLRVEPARCRSCGFVFRKRRKLKTPSRCPKCKSERIDEPVFWIE